MISIIEVPRTPPIIATGGRIKNEKEVENSPSMFKITSSEIEGRHDDDEQAALYGPQKRDKLNHLIKQTILTLDNVAGHSAAKTRPYPDDSPRFTSAEQKDATVGRRKEWKNFADY